MLISSHRIGFIVLSFMSTFIGSYASGSERYAALECQDRGIFVIVNYYPHKVFQLSWGRDDALIQADLPVVRTVDGEWENFHGPGVHLQLPVSKGRDSIDARTGVLKASTVPQRKFSNLRCLLYGAD